MIERCTWAARAGELDIAYHDREWGVPVHDDRTLFEFLTLEGAQAGLSWTTILKKRDNYRAAFANFDIAKVARFDKRKIARLLEDPGIVRNRLKIESTVINAKCALEIQSDNGSFADYLWAFVGGKPIQQITGVSALSDRRYATRLCRPSAWSTITRPGVFDTRHFARGAASAGASGRGPAP